LRPLAAALAATAALTGSVPSAPAAMGSVTSVPDPGPGASFELTRARAKPGLAFFDAKRETELRFRFRGEAPLDLRVEVVKGRDGNPVRRWIVGSAAPGERHERSWNGLNERGRAVPDGRYTFRVGPTGRKPRAADSVELHGHRFPIPGPHSYREGEGDFGAPRPGRVHEGKDVWASCGSRLVAARGGRVARRGYDPRLYGHFLVVDARGTRADHFYVHLAAPSPQHEGERVRTGERIGSVGRSGNAQSVGCMLHLEIWPRGFRKGDPIDPEPHLRAWDRWS
jgi:murein DD-endopeptidase MepM/ murein hydrolase activator NlpD